MNIFLIAKYLNESIIKLYYSMTSFDKLLNYILFMNPDHIFIDINLIYLDIFIEFQISQEWLLQSLCIKSKR